MLHCEIYCRTLLIPRTYGFSTRWGFLQDFLWVTNFLVLSTSRHIHRKRFMETAQRTWHDPTINLCRFPTCLTIMVRCSACFVLSGGAFVMRTGRSARHSFRMRNLQYRNDTRTTTRCSNGLLSCIMRRSIYSVRVMW